MTIPIPTIDDFDTSTVMTTIREVVDYLIGMVPQINNGDITDLQTSYTNNVLTITLVKGDGTNISKNVTIQGGSGTESPYPTDVALSLSGTVLNCDITLSNNTHVEGSQNLATFATDAEVQGIKSDLQEQITGIKPTVTVNENVNPPTISVAVNGTTSTANLPSNGKVNIEKLDLTNLPTDFNAGDLLIINCKFSIKNKSAGLSWTSQIQYESAIASEDDISATVVLTIPQSNATKPLPVYTSSYTSDVEILGGIYIYNVEEWNNPQSAHIIGIQWITFNASDKNDGLKILNRTTVTQFIHSIYRIKNGDSQ